MARKPGRNRMKIWYGAPGKVIDEKEIREGYREDKNRTHNT